MKSDIFQKALLATAKVACCASLLAACQVEPEKRPTKIEENKPVPTAASQPPATKETKPESQPQSTSAPADPLADCRAHTIAVFTTKTETESAKTKECCIKVSEDMFAKSLTEPGAGVWREKNQCCALIGDPVGACMAWGPPCPPSMGV